MKTLCKGISLSNSNSREGLAIKAPTVGILLRLSPTPTWMAGAIPITKTNNSNSSNNNSNNNSNSRNSSNSNQAQDKTDKIQTSSTFKVLCLTSRTCSPNFRPRTQTWTWTSMVCLTVSSLALSRATPTPQTEEGQATHSNSFSSMAKVSNRISSNSTIRMKNTTMKMHSNWTRMEFLCHLPRRSRTSSTRFQASSMRRRSSHLPAQKRRRKKTAVLFASMTCRAVRWWKHLRVLTSSTASASTFGWNKNSNAHCAKRE